MFARSALSAALCLAVPLLCAASLAPGLVPSFVEVMVFCLKSVILVIALSPMLMLAMIPFAVLVAVAGGVSVLIFRAQRALGAGAARARVCARLAGMSLVSVGGAQLLLSVSGSDVGWVMAAAAALVAAAVFVCRDEWVWDWLWRLPVAEARE